jgi:lipoprotein-anchoring transpeptidase ErfK/SrfK
MGPILDGVNLTCDSPIGGGETDTQKGGESKMSDSKIGVFILALIIAGSGPAPTAIAGDETAGNKKIVVIIDSQILLALEGSKIVYEYDVITGRPKKETHPGDYRIFKKHKDYTSKTYGSPMPYTMFFSKDGKAIHGTEWATIRSYLHAYLTESVGSQGCVGLTEEDARTLFNWTPIGTLI